MAPDRFFVVTPPRYRGRFAPSPTGPLHLGSLVTAIGSWLIARHHHGDWLVRIEDIDPQREIPGAALRQIETLAAFGMQSDEPILWQSQRGDAYSAALDRLVQGGKAFACACSRTDLANTDGIHRQCVTQDSMHAPKDRQSSMRLRVGDGRVGFDDAIQGRFEQLAERDIGDIVLRRADGLWAYQLAVVVDDAAQGITEVVRGADLLDSTPRQILLQRTLDLPTPAYAHLPLVVDADGCKLGKSSDARAIGVENPLPVLRAALHLLGQDARVIDGANSAETALDRAMAAFDIDAVRRIGTKVATTATSPA